MKNANKAQKDMWTALGVIHTQVDKELNDLLLSYLTKYLAGEELGLISEPRLTVQDVNRFTKEGLFLSPSGVQVHFRFEIRNFPVMTDAELESTWASGLRDHNLTLDLSPSPVSQTMLDDELECSEDGDF